MNANNETVIWIAVLRGIRALRTWLVPVGLLLVILWNYRQVFMEAIRTISDWEAVASYIQAYGPLGPVALSMLVVLQVFVAFVPGHALAIASGYIYGSGFTILIVAGSAILGSEIAFWLARKYGRPLIYRLASPSAIERWDRLAGNRGAMFYFFTLLLPFIPNDMMCYVAGLGNIQRKRFFAANVSARLISTVAMTLIGSFKLKPPPGYWLLFIGGLGALYIGWGYYNNAFRIFRSREAFANSCTFWIMKAYKSFFRLHYRIQGLENLPPGPKILAANHPCASDAILLPPIFEDRIIGLAEAGQFKNPIIGWLMSHSGHIPVHAENPQEAFELARRALASGKTVLIFPEGKLSSEYREGKARTGAVRLSIAANAPIIPIGINVSDSDTINLRWRTRARWHGGRYQFRGMYAVCIGRAWHPRWNKAERPAPFEVHEQTRLLMDQINELAQCAAKENRK